MLDADEATGGTLAGSGSLSNDLSEAVATLQRLQRKLGLLSHLLPFLEGREGIAAEDVETVLADLLACLFEADAFGVVVLAADNRIKAANSAFSRMIAADRADILGLDFSAMLAPDTSDPLEADERRSAGGFQADLTLQSRNGDRVEARAVVQCHATEAAAHTVLVLFPLVDNPSHLATARAERQRAEAAEERLDRQDDLAAQLWRSLPGAHVVFRLPERQVMQVTGDFIQLAQRAPESFIDKPSHQLFHDAPILVTEDEMARLERSADRAIATGSVDEVPDAQVELTELEVSPRRRIWRVLHTPVQSDDGESRLLVRTVEDVTEERTRKKEQAEQRRVMRIGEEAAGIGAWWWNAVTGRILLSPRLARMFEFLPGTQLDRDEFATLIDPRDREAVLASLDRCATAGTPFEIEHSASTRSGNILQVLAAGVPELDDNGRVVMISGIVQDITARKEAEREAREGQERAESLAEAIPIKVFMLDRNGNILYLNKVFRDYVGVHHANEPDARIFERVHPEQHDEFHEKWAEARKEAREFNCEIRLKSKGGVYRWHDLRSVPVFDDEEQLRGWYGAASDFDDMKTAEVRLKTLSDRLQSIVGSVTAGLAQIDRNWTITFLNEPAARLVGRPQDELIDRRLWDLFPQAIGTELYTRFQAAIENGRHDRFEFHFVSLDTWFDFSIYPSQTGLTVLFTDITEPRRNLERVRLMETALATMDDMVLITEWQPIDDPGPRIMYVNQAFERITGYSAKEAIGQSPRMLQGEKTDRNTLDQIRDALRKEEPIRREVLNYTRTGREYWVDLSITPLIDEEQNLRAYVSVQRDETARKRQQAMVEWQAQMIEQAQDAIVVVELGGRIVYWNRSAESLYGWSSQEALGQSVTDLLEPEENEFQEADATVRAEGHWLGRVAQRTRSGQTIRVSSKWTYVPGIQNFPDTIMIINTDITRRMLLDEELGRMQRLESIGQMTGGVAHDFNNILTIVMGSADMTLLKAGDDGEIARLANMSKSAAERGRDLVKRLLAFARRQELEPAPTDVNHLIRDMLKMLENALEESVAIDLALQDDLWLATVDRAALEQALTNLCLNARDAMMPAGGTMTIETRNDVLDTNYTDRHVDTEPGPYVRISITDEGTGMDKATSERVLEPFFTTKTDAGGTGLGLSMVYGFVKQSGGHLRIYSEVDRGTTIRLWLPMSEEKNQKVAEQPGSTETPHGDETILVVEDDEAVRKNVLQMISDLGYEVVEATRGEEALAMLESRDDIDLLFTDVVMPGAIDGRRLAEVAREADPDLPVLFTSGYAGASLRRRQQDLPRSGVLDKPYRVVELAQMLRRLLDEGS